MLTLSIVPRRGMAQAHGWSAATPAAPVSDPKSGCASVTFRKVDSIEGIKLIVRTESVPGSRSSLRLQRCPRSGQGLRCGMTAVRDDGDAGMTAMRG